MGPYSKAPAADEDPALDGDAPVVQHGLEVVEGDLFQLHVALDAWDRHGQEVGMSVQGHVAVLEDDGVEMKIRGIRPILGPDVPDVLGEEVDPADLERGEGPLVDVGHPTVRHADLVDLQGVDRLERLLPAVFLDRRRILGLGAQLLEVHVQGGLRQGEVGDQSAAEERLPLDARIQARRVEDGRIGVGLLDELQIIEGQREPDRMEAELPDVRAVPLQLLVHLAHHYAAERLIDKERGDDGQHD